MPHFRGFVTSPFAAAPRPTTSDKGKHADQSAIDWPSGAIETDLAHNAHKCFNDLDNKNQEECKVD